MDNPRESNISTLVLNAVIGFLSILLIILLFALITRIVYPRVVAERTDPDPALVSSIIQLEVLNGCGIPGIATAYTGSLREFGFDVVETGNFDHFDVSKTFIVSRSGSMGNALRVAKTIGIEEKNVIREESDHYYLDVTLVIGSDHENLNL